MKQLHAEGKTIAVRLAAALMLMAALESLAFAQRGGSPPVPDARRLDEMNRQGRQYEIDQLSRELKGAPDKSTDPAVAQAMAQIKHDFEGLQDGYNKIVLAMQSKQGLDYDSLLDPVAEIRKCSGRLKGSLALPRPKDDQDAAPPVKSDSGRIEEPLLQLQKYIYSFVTNPVFDARGVLDVVQATKASRDIDRIIELSETIRKSGERLRKHAN